ncbi:MAG: undecaprenyldiphospho-muramoylpentapeptide beta-N-acetylglucosaminyltransferase [Terriglobia bacterium]
MTSTGQKETSATPSPSPQIGGGERNTVLRVLMAAGGTGGHIFPALAVAEELRARWSGPCDLAAGACRIEFVGAGREIEKRLIPAALFPLHVVAAAGLKGIGGLRKLRNFLVLPRSFWETWKLLSSLRPHVVVGVGGYVGGPVMLLAALRGIPTLLIEPNATPGFTNRILAPFIRMAALGFKDAAPIYGAKARVTGHPVRAAFNNITPKPHAPPYTILVIGGSQGSIAINTAVTGALSLFSREDGQYKLVHQTGKRDFERVSQIYKKEAGISAEASAFIDDVPRAFADADLMIGRSGASTVAELASAGKASLLIPFPHAADDHQLANARALERAGGARVLEQRELTPLRLFEEVTALCTPETLAKMDQAARALSHPDATARIADLIEGLAGC